MTTDTDKELDRYWSKRALDAEERVLRLSEALERVLHLLELEGYEPGDGGFDDAYRVLRLRGVRQ